MKSIRFLARVIPGMILTGIMTAAIPAAAAEGPILQPEKSSQVGDYAPGVSKSGDVTFLGLNPTKGTYFPLVPSIYQGYGNNTSNMYSGPKQDFPQFLPVYVNANGDSISVKPGPDKDAVMRVNLNGNFGTIHITGSWEYNNFGTPLRASIYIGSSNDAKPIWQSSNAPANQQIPLDVTLPYHAGDQLFFDMGQQNTTASQWTAGEWINLAIQPVSGGGTSTGNSSSQGALTKDQVRQDFMDALGRVPTDAELSTLYAQTDWTNDTLLQHFRDTIKSNAALQLTLINNAYTTVFWRGPTLAEVHYWEQKLSQTGIDFQELIANHIDFLRTNEAVRVAAINNAHLIYVGRSATSDELNYWSKQFESGTVKTYQDLVSQMEVPLKNNTSLQEDIISRSYLAAFGRTETKAEFLYWQTYLKKGELNYTALIQMHRQYLEKDSTSRANTIRMSYLKVFKRLPTTAEFQYWDQYVQKVGLTYDELIQAHRNWLQANAKALSLGPNTQAALAKQGLAIDSKSGDIIDTKTGHIKYLSGDYVIGTMDGKGNVIQTGSSNVIAAGGANVIAAGGANVIAAGGANVIAAGGANVIAAGGANVINAGGANVIAAGGANMVGGGANLDPGQLLLANGASVIAAGGAN